MGSQSSTSRRQNPTTRKSSLALRPSTSPRTSKSENPTRTPSATFADLPTELRLEIWRYLSHTERVIAIKWSSSKQKFTSFAKVPTVLHLCSESRAEALNYYHLALGGNRRIAQPKTRAKGKVKSQGIYVNFDVDRICLDNTPGQNLRTHKTGCHGFCQKHQSCRRETIEYYDTWPQEEFTECLKVLLDRASTGDIARIRHLDIGCSEAAIFSNFFRLYYREYISQHGLIDFPAGPSALSKGTPLPDSHWQNHGIYERLPQFVRLENLRFCLRTNPYVVPEHEVAGMWKYAEGLAVYLQRVAELQTPSSRPSPHGKGWRPPRLEVSPLTCAENMEQLYGVRSG